MQHPIPIQTPQERHRKAGLGQFLTPGPVADLMASFFDANGEVVNLLDAGSGEGALTISFVRSLLGRTQRPQRLSVTAYEIDPALIPVLQANLTECARECEAAGVQFSFKVVVEDFISAGAKMARGSLFETPAPQFTAAIVNPPYKKIRSDSSTRDLLRTAGIETVNLYAGFLALITRLLMTGGELVAITPRSYCNGPYFKPFRSDFLDAMSLQRLHVFESRTAAFRDDRVLQENVIVHAVRGVPKRDHIAISTSSGKPGDLLRERIVRRDQVIFPGDRQQFIHLPTDDSYDSARIYMGTLKCSLGDLRLDVSTGRVVDFRAKQYLRQEPASNTVPLVYACHFNRGFIDWPGDQRRKPNAIVVAKPTRELLIPAGVYVLVKRFSAKEERRRIVACIYDPDRVPAPLVGLENHLNYYHCSGSGMSMPLAKGLAAFLNSTVVDKYFRQFSGHTQVNATDLRGLPYPTLTALEYIGNSKSDTDLPQDELDRLVEGAVA
jgi:adenine-specific DNA-methyltransferase